MRQRIAGQIDRGGSGKRCRQQNLDIKSSGERIACTCRNPVVRTLTAGFDDTVRLLVNEIDIVASSTQQRIRPQPAVQGVGRTIPGQRVAKRRSGQVGDTGKAIARRIAPVGGAGPKVYRDGSSGIGIADPVPGPADKPVEQLPGQHRIGGGVTGVDDPYRVDLALDPGAAVIGKGGDAAGAKERQIGIGLVVEEAALADDRDRTRHATAIIGQDPHSYILIGKSHLIGDGQKPARQAGHLDIAVEEAVLGKAGVGCVGKAEQSARAVETRHGDVRRKGVPFVVFVKDCKAGVGRNHLRIGVKAAEVVDQSIAQDRPAGLGIDRHPDLSIGPRCPFPGHHDITIVQCGDGGVAFIDADDATNAEPQLQSACAVEECDVEIGIAANQILADNGKAAVLQGGDIGIAGPGIADVDGVADKIAVGVADAVHD